MKYRIFLSAFFFSFLLGVNTQAEYRVFVLKISKRAPASASPDASPENPPQSTNFRLVESNLDPEQYRSFYPVQADEDIVYIDTWRCYGRTDNFKPFCPNPKGQNPVPANPAT